jgi:hypothetical protein
MTMLAFNHMQRLRSAAEVVGSLVGDGGRREFFEQFAAVDGRPTDGPVVPSAGQWSRHRVSANQDRWVQDGTLRSLFGIGRSV